ncbi:MAG TPA: hypothetical protein VMW27_01750 [Thermoanaerobaculia bacterium]|nr:hypothetical protein [Thermoanaerobaculia bacterium]
MTLFSCTSIRSSLFLLLLLPALAAPLEAAEAGGPRAPSAEALRKLEAKEKAEALRPPDSPDEAQAYFYAKRAPAGQKAVPVERYFTAQEQMRRMPQYSTARGTFLPSRAALEEKGLSYVSEAASLGAWSSLGPGNIGGRTRNLVIDPRRPEVMYAGGVAGGVWKTTNGGESWFPLADLMGNLAVAALAMDPANSNVLYAGTGEGFTVVGVRGNGIFKTTDGGIRWARLASTQTASFQYVSDIVVSPGSSSRLYAATHTGVWRSTNGGRSWKRILDPGPALGGCLDLAIRKDRVDDVVFAACGNRALATGAVYQNLKAQSNGQWVQVLQEPGMGRASLALAPSNQDVIYALTSSTVSGPSRETGENYRNGLHAVFRSTSGGGPGTWSAQVRNSDDTKLNRVLLSRALSAFGRECGSTSGNNSFSGQGWYDNAIAVDPTNPDRVWTGGIDLFRSDDGGRNWGLASYWWAKFPYAEEAPSYAHADQHFIVFHPRYDGTSNRTLFVTNDGGIFRTDDALAATARGALAACEPSNSQLVWTALNNGYGVTQFYHGAPYPDGRRYLGGTQDNGTIRGSDGDGADAWETLLGGDGGYAAVHPQNPDILYASYQGLSLSKSVDGGQTWDFAVEGIDGLTLFIAPYVMDPNDPERLWLGGEGLWRTDNGAGLWQTAAAPFFDFGAVSALAVARGNPDRVLAGTMDGYVLRTDAGRTADPSTVWPAVRPRTGWVSSVAIDPANADVVYATYSTFGGTHVWKSTNGGATWRGIDGTGNRKIPDIPVHTLVVDPSRSSRLFVGTDLGVFVSTDGGAAWAVENTSFANVITEWLTVIAGPSGPTLFAFTHGRGAWRVPIRN